MMYVMVCYAMLGFRFMCVLRYVDNPDIYIYIYIYIFIYIFIYLFIACYALPGCVVQGYVMYASMHVNVLMYTCTVYVYMHAFIAV